MKFHSIFVTLLILLSPVVYGNNFKLIGDAVAQASEVTEQQVAELYVATFNRAPDKPGLDFWVNDSGFTIEQIAESFFDQTETQELYSSGTTETVFVTSVYNNLFNRAPDVAGLAYWVDALGSGAVTRPVMIEAVKNGAQGTDAEIVSNKAEVGLYYASLGLEGGGFSLADVTDDVTVDTTKGLIDGISTAPLGYLIITGTNSDILNDHFFIPDSIENLANGDKKWLINNGEDGWSLIIGLVPNSPKQAYSVTFNNGWTTEQIMDYFYVFSPVSGITINDTSIIFKSVSGSDRLTLNGTLLLQ